MIQEECFFRNHFWIEQKKSYEPLVDVDSERLSVGFQWTDDFLLFRFTERSTLSFQVTWPEYQKKDALVLFLDTRPSLRSRTFTRSFHSFLFLPEAVEGVYFKDITRFQGYETRPLLKDNVLPVEKIIHKQTRAYQVQIPLDLLWGFEKETDQFSFAFTYYSEKEEPFHFPVPRILPERIPYVWPICHRRRDVDG